ncbi:MAG: class I SAM-dependent methyltransferase [Actinomycetota bacterium]
MSVVARALLRTIGGQVRVGSLTVRDPEGGIHVFTGDAPGPSAEVVLREWSLLPALATTGAIALADGWIAETFDSPDLPALIELSTLHLEREHRTLPPWIERPGQALWRAIGRASATRGPITDMAQHYDLGNAFYALWLDETMTYSSAYFLDDAMTLADAQREKYRRLAARTGIERGARVLEIGSGWGAFGAYLAGDLGCDVTTLTISREQAAYVEDLIARRGLGDRYRVLVQDFEASSGRFDAVVSVEMIESIPGSRWPAFFRVLRDRLEPGGRVGLQSIVVADRHWRDSNANPDFVRRYIFPGGQVPSPGVLRASAERVGLDWLDEEWFGASYARTLAAWHRNFDAAWDRIAPLGFDRRFQRMWQYYLSYTEGGFRAGRVDVGQVVLGRP